MSCGILDCLGIALASLVVGLAVGAGASLAVGSRKPRKALPARKES